MNNEVQFVESDDYENAVRIIKHEMIPYYSDVGVAWDDESKMEAYKGSKLYHVQAGEKVGIAMTSEDDEHFYLSELHIDQSKRNKGYGLKSIKIAAELAASAGFEGIRVRVFKNNPAYRLYLRSGFVLEKELPYTFQLVARTHDIGLH